MPLNPSVLPLKAKQRTAADQQPHGTTVCTDDKIVIQLSRMRLRTSSLTNFCHTLISTEIGQTRMVYGVSCCPTRLLAYVKRNDYWSGTSRRSSLLLHLWHKSCIRGYNDILNMFDILGLQGVFVSCTFVTSNLDNVPKYGSSVVERQLRTAASVKDMATATEQSDVMSQSG